MRSARAAGVEYSDARELVRSWLELEWGSTEGTPWVAEEGFVDVLDYLVPWGAREWLVDEDPEFILMNNTATFVDRRTGDIRHEAMSSMFDKVDAMDRVRVGETPPRRP